MKNTFFISCFALLFGISAQAQKKQATTPKQIVVPENVNTTFKSLFAVAEQNQWNKNYSGNYVANFVNAEKLNQSAEFNESGAMVKSKTSYALDAIPENISNSLKAQYPEAKVTECAKMQMPGVVPYYKVKIIGADNTAKEILISEEGTIAE